METLEALNFETSDRKAWYILRMLDGGASKQCETVSVLPIYGQLRKLLEAKLTHIKKELKSLKPNSVILDHSLLIKFDEISQALRNIRTRDSTGFDHPEFLIHLGRYNRE